jgi:hypothetical protein
MAKQHMTEIAPGIKAFQWTCLDLDDPKSLDWDTAIQILRRRIEDRYITPVDLLIKAERKKPPTQRHFGFTILAIDCLLVETLQALRDGKTDTRHDSKKMFLTFLTSRPEFMSHFTKLTAERFYRDFRCGILHQAEIRGKSRVWSVGKLTAIIQNSFTVNRTKFHAALIIEFSQYLNELRDSANTTLRENFRKKMDFICTL